MKQRFYQVIILGLVICSAFTFGACGSFGDNTEYSVLSSGNQTADGYIYDLYENRTASITGYIGQEVVINITESLDG
jgi:hypothetical protein